MNIYHFHPVSGVFVGQGVADESPLEEGVFLIPAHATPLALPNVPDGSRAVFNGASWAVEVIPPAPTPDDPPEPGPFVLTCSPWQIRKALNATGLRAAVDSAVSGADQTTKDAWEFAQEFRRDNPLITAVANALGKTEAEIDDLFALAVSL